MALQSTVSNIAAGLGSLFSAAYLTEDAVRRLVGFDDLAWLYAGAGTAAGIGVLVLLRAIHARSDASTTQEGRTQPAGES